MSITHTKLRASLIGLCISLAGWAGGVRVGRADNNEGAIPKAAKCVHVTTSAPYRGFGYDHMVDLENTCDKPQTCDVKTNVNPEPQTVKVAPGKTTTVVTFRGSPAREFKAEVDCKPDSNPDGKSAG